MVLKREKLGWLNKLRLLQVSLIFQGWVKVKGSDNNLKY